MVNCKFLWQYFLLSTDLTSSEPSAEGRQGQGHTPTRIPSCFKVKGKESTSSMSHRISSGSCSPLWPLLIRSRFTGIAEDVTIPVHWTHWRPWKRENNRDNTNYILQSRFRMRAVKSTTCNKTQFVPLSEIPFWCRSPQFSHLERWQAAGQWIQSRWYPALALAPRASPVASVSPKAFLTAHRDQLRHLSEEAGGSSTVAEVGDAFRRDMRSRCGHRHS